MGPVTVLGVDPGMTGGAALVRLDAEGWRIVGLQPLRTDRADPIVRRYGDYWRALLAFASSQGRPDVAVVEHVSGVQAGVWKDGKQQPFNADSSKLHTTVGLGVGVALAIGVPEVLLIDPRSARKSAMGRGNASKQEVAAWFSVQPRPPELKRSNDGTRDATVLAVAGALRYREARS